MLEEQGTRPVDPDFSVGSVIVTRNRPAMLRQTLASIKESSYPINEIIVSDDSSNGDTAAMLAEEFPDAIRVAGPQRGISANRNKGVSVASTEYILLSDDDIVIDPQFVDLAVQEVRNSNASLVFAAICDNGRDILPNTFDFLGFSSRPYSSGSRYNTANQQCFLISRKLLQVIPYDEVIETYGYEEMDFAYRIAATGARIACVPLCSNLHLAPNFDNPRPEKDASRLYVTFKRFAYVDKRPLIAFAFLCVAVPHHVIACVRRRGPVGLRQAFEHLQLAARMLRRFQQSGYDHAVSRK